MSKALIRIRDLQLEGGLGRQIKLTIVSSQVAQTSWQLQWITQPFMQGFRNSSLFHNKKGIQAGKDGLPGL